MAVLAVPLLLLLCTVASFQEGSAHKLSPERMVFQTDFGDLHMAFYHEVAPVSAAHIRRLGELGGYNTNHFFRVDKGFVAQTADVPGGRAFPLNARQHAQAELTVPLEVRPDAKHDKRGILSMARHSDPNSGGSSFSVLLGPAPHLDMQYTVFGEVTAGLATLTAMEGVETTREGIFVMPKERITIHSTYM